jgi:hypothetical protein
MFYPALQKGPYKVPGFHDPDSKRLVGLILRPDPWTSGLVYYKYDDDNYDIVIPSVFTGLYYKVKQPGLSGGTEPTWVKIPGEETVDSTNGLVWEAVLYNLMPVGENISAVTYLTTDGVTVSATSFTNNTIQFTIDPLPPAAETAGRFDVTVHVTKSTSAIADYTLRFKVAER